MSASVDLSRRRFLVGSAQASGLVLSVGLLAGCHPFADDPIAGSVAPNLFVTINRDGAVIITCHRSEMGQQIRTSIAQIIADELEADWAKVVVTQAAGDPKYGDQNTDGSRSVRRNFIRLRQAGATARQLLREAAAQTWDVPIDTVEATQHQVRHGQSGRSLGYGELVDIAARLPVPDPDTVPLKARKDWRYIGKAVQSIDVDNVLAGTAVYAFDVDRPGMQVAVIARPPVLFGRVRQLNDKAARAIPGVTDVVRLPPLAPPAAFKALGGVAVIATSTWAALRGRDALEVEWDHGDNAGFTSGPFMRAMRATARAPGEVTRNHGDVDTALAEADQRLAAEYTMPLLSQAPMEPPSATAEIHDDTIEIWACTQTPQSTRRTVAQALGMEAEQVTVNVTLLGGGFGRKSKPDFSVEAALLAREVGTPVKVIWTREDDIKNGYYHSVSAQRIEAGIDADGNTTAWLHRTVFPPIPSTFDVSQTLPSHGELRLGFSDNPFDVPNLRLERGAAKAHVRIGWLRAVANVYHAFAIQSFAHELAVAAERDPKDYLLELIGPPRHLDLAKAGVEYDNYGDPIDVFPIDTGRLAHVIREVAERSDWESKRRAGRALGIAAHRSFLSYVATVVEVEVDDDGNWSIPHAYVAIDAGTVVNTDHVRAQCEGGSVYGLSCAIGAITATDGIVDQGNFNDYLVTRMNQAPATIDVHIVESDAPPAGVGEPPTPPFAPALANAIYEATGTRYRDLPIPLRVKRAS
ncbi:MAG: molybdopterin cofactor-binding domain-containing protein [Pseudomonadota bacterium]